MNARILKIAKEQIALCGEMADGDLCDIVARKFYGKDYTDQHGAIVWKEIMSAVAAGDLATEDIGDFVLVS